MIRFVIEIDGTWSRTIRCQLGNWTLPSQPLVAQPAVHWSGTPAGAGTLWYRGQSLADLISATGRLVTRPVDPGFGPLAPRMAKYLFDALIGDADWQQIIAHADRQEANPKVPIELALRVDLSGAAADSVSDLWRLQGLSWELICSVATAGRRLVTVTRLISSPAQPTPLSWPPRILFVLSTSLNDESLRPAMEAMGLLSHFELKQGPDTLNALRPDLHSRVLENATIDTLKSKVASFRPEIVYFICHGRAGQLILKQEEPAKKVPTAAHLITSLTSLGWTPSVVILAACDSASVVIAGPDVSGSLAAQLVDQGIPIVIGMGGKISSAGCRLFTRALADSLFQEPGNTLVESICLARGVARRVQANNNEPAEWALPTLFMADNPATEIYQAISAVAIDRRERWEKRVRSLNLADSPVFCCREALASIYQRVVEEDGISVVLTCAAGTDHGKSRALKEIGVWALRDGHIPFPVLANRPDWDAPLTPRRFGLYLLDALDAVRIAFEFPQPIAGELLTLLLPQGVTVPADLTRPAYNRLLGSIRTSQAPEPEHVSIRDAFGIDAMLLRNKIVTQFPKEFNQKTRCLLLLDDGHKYLTLLQETLVPQYGHVATHGFGEGRDVIPVFIALDRDNKLDVGGLTEQHWLTEVNLSPFREGLESEIAYERVLLNPFDQEISKTPLCFDPGNPEQVQKWRKVFHREIRGIPGELGRGKALGRLVKIALEFVLIDADDPARIRELVRELNAP